MKKNEVISNEPMEEIVVKAVPKIKILRPAVAIALAGKVVSGLPRPDIKCTMEEVTWGVPGVLIKVRDREDKVIQALKITSANIQQIEYERD